MKTTTTDVERSERVTAGWTGGLPRRLPPGPQTVLVADDEHLVASALARDLAQMGYSVIGPAPDGEQAIEMCRNRRPDLALLDIRMAPADGLDATEVIFGQLGVPVVLISGFSDPEYVEAGSRLGVFGYLLKPVTSDQLRVGISLAWARYADAAETGAEIKALKRRLEDRKMIEQAKWILVKRRDIDEPEAMRLLQTQARNSRKTLSDVARAVLESENLLAPDP